MKYTLFALAVAAAATLGSLLLSLALGLKACPLCLYQRMLMMAAAAVLGVGLLADPRRWGLLCLLSTAPATAGLSVAGFHQYLVTSGVLECPKGLSGLVAAPLESLLAFAVLSALVLVGAWQGEPARRGRILAPLAVILGALLAWGAIASAPPLPPAPSAPYDPQTQPLDMCRPAPAR